MPSPEFRQLIRERGVLETIRDKPAMWLGKKSISKLRAFYEGYFCCLEVQTNGGVSWSLKEDAGMNSWTAYRLDVDPGPKGYVELLLEHYRDEARALDKFYELLDEYKGRKVTVVATLHGDVEIVTYTSNKGFFVITPANPHAYIGAGEYWPDWKTFVDRRRVSLDQITVLDQTAFARLIAPWKS